MLQAHALRAMALITAAGVLSSRPIPPCIAVAAPPWRTRSLPTAPTPHPPAKSMHTLGPIAPHPFAAPTDIPAKMCSSIHTTRHDHSYDIEPSSRPASCALQPHPPHTQNASQKHPIRASTQSVRRPSPLLLLPPYPFPTAKPCAMQLRDPMASNPLPSPTHAKRT